MTSRQKILDLFFCRWKNNESSVERQRLRCMAFSSLIAIAGLVALCVLNLHTQETALAIVDGVLIILIFAINIGARYFLGYRVSLLLLTTLYFLFCVSSVFLKADPSVGVFWILLLPMIAIPVLGQQLGMLQVISGGIFIACVIFDDKLLRLLPNSYSVSFGVHFFLAYVLISLFSHYAESLRVSLESDLRERNRNLDALARTDSLTGLSNRRDIFEKIRYEAIRCERNQRTFGIILGDIDAFKAVNDRYGHSVGDAVLKTVAATLMETIRAQDSIAHWGTDPSALYGYSSRYGGEEFLILLPETDLNGARNAAEKLRQKITEVPIALPNLSSPIQITMSFGVALCRGPDDIDRAIQEADEMLYRAKAQGRNQVQSAEP